MCSGYSVSSAREAPEWGRPVSGWMCMPGAQVKGKGGMWTGEPSAQRQWMKVCDRWGCLESGPPEKTKDPILRGLEAQKQSEGVGPAKEPKNPCTKKCLN